MNLIAASQLDSSELILSIRVLIMPAGLYWLKDAVPKCKRGRQIWLQAAWSHWMVQWSVSSCRGAWHIPFRSAGLEFFASNYWRAPSPSSNDTWFAFLSIRQLDVRCDQLREAGAATRVTGTSFLVRICG